MHFFDIRYGQLDFRMYRQGAQVVNLFCDWGLLLFNFWGVFVVLFFIFFLNAERTPGEEYYENLCMRSVNQSIGRFLCSQLFPEIQICFLLSPVIVKICLFLYFCTPLWIASAFFDIFFLLICAVPGSNIYIGIYIIIFIFF